MKIITNYHHLSDMFLAYIEEIMASNMNNNIYLTKIALRVFVKT